MHFFHYHKDIIQAWAANIIAVGATIKDVNEFLTTVSVLLAIVLTLSKFKKKKE